MELTKKDKRHIEEEVRKLQFRIVAESREYARLYEKTYLEALKEKIDERIDVIEQCNNSMLKLSEPNKIAMIKNLKVSYTKNSDLHVTLEPVAEVEQNLPYELATLFAQIIEDSQVNSELVLTLLAESLSYDIEIKNK